MSQKENQLKILVGTSIFCLASLFIRVQVTGNFGYAFLVWNLLLAWIPYLISEKLNEEKFRLRNWKTGILLFAWLTFFPNAPYIVTDLIHLKGRTDEFVWLDMFVICLFSWNGVMLAFFSLRKIHRIILVNFSERLAWWCIGGLSVISGYGVYLGRFERWNTWDLATNPFKFIVHIGNELTQKELLPEILGFTAIFGIFILAMYVTFHYLLQLKENQNG